MIDITQEQFEQFETVMKRMVNRRYWYYDKDELLAIGYYAIGLAVVTATEDSPALLHLVTKVIRTEFLKYLYPTKGKDTAGTLYIGSDIDQALVDTCHPMLDTYKCLVEVNIEQQEANILDEINALEGFERCCIVYKYGILGHSKYTQQEIAEAWGYSKVYVAKVQQRVLDKLALKLGIHRQRKITNKGGKQHE